MILKKKFIDKLAITQGRHLKIINNKIQLFPDKLWKQELKLFNKTNLKFVEWVVSKDNFSKNPICKINGYKIINNHLKKNNLKCRSIDLDFIVKENPLNYSEKKLKIFIKKIEIIGLNCHKIGIKYFICPFLENSSPKGKLKMNKLVYLLNLIKNKISKKLLILIETDLTPNSICILIKKMNNEIYINYDLGNSASKNYNFENEKKYFKFVKNIHLKDRIKYGTTVRFGLGNANFKKMFNYLIKNKNSYDFTLQPARSKCNKDIKEIKLNIEYIDQLLLNL
jgi:hypothetical protein